MYDLLKTIDSPMSLRKLERDSLPALAVELRSYLLETVSKTGGHLSSNLGTVELTIALHYVFNTPIDRIVWDVGHQTYPHKILTGRRDEMLTLRKFGGISGFPRRAESEYDTFGTGHSSTSISAAFGMAIANQLKHEVRYSIAVIGDGAMTAGMAFEALNISGALENIPLVVVLNDNDMSISPPVGALSRYLTKLMSAQSYANAKKNVQKVLSVAPPVLEFARKIEDRTKGIFIPTTLFKEFGFNYTGPIDGHNLDLLISTFQNVQKLKGPQFLHVVTKKGKGYKPAEEDPVLYHGSGKFNPLEGIRKINSNIKTYTNIFSECLCDMAELDSKVIGITPAMREGSGLVEFEQRFPERYFDVGIAEQHAITFAGGLATEGFKPIVAIYSTFLQRGYDQLIHDIAIQNLPVTFAIDRAGLVGDDGPTHAGVYDICFMRCIPNMTIMVPSDENECRQMLYTAVQLGTPASVRYPRGIGVGIKPNKKFEIFPVGKARILREKAYAINEIHGIRVAILAFGSMVAPSLIAGEIIDATVINMRFVKPIDEKLLLSLATTHDVFVTVEEGTIMGGAGSACVEAFLKHKINPPVLQLGLPDEFIEQGDHAMLLASYGLNAAGIVSSILERFIKKPKLDFRKETVT